MRKLRTKIGAMIASAMLAVALMAMPVSAGTTYEPVSGDDDVTFTKYLVINQGDDVPDLTFDFQITSGTKIEAGTDTVAVLPGPVVKTGDVVTAPTVENAVFAKNDTVYDAVQGTDQVSLAVGDVYAKQSVVIDFSGVEFTEPGVYRYILSEVNGGVSGVSYDAQVGTGGTAGQRTLDVYVIDAGTIDATSQKPKLTVHSYLLHKDLAAPAKDKNSFGTAGSAIADKSDGFVNLHEAYDLKFSKTVSGNQASKDKYFEFTLTITNAIPDTVYDVSYGNDGNPATTDGDADLQPTPNAATTKFDTQIDQPTSIRVGSSGDVTQKFYLQHGQSIAIRGLSQGTMYNLSEDAEDYNATSQTDDAKASTSGGNSVINTAGIIADVTVTFTNTRNGVIPTGVILSVAPWVIAGVVIIGGIVFFAIRSKKKYEEE